MYRYASLLKGFGMSNLLFPFKDETMIEQSASSDSSSQSVFPSHLWFISTQSPILQVNWDSLQNENVKIEV